MPQSLIDPKDSLERQNEKLLKIISTLMRRAEQGSDAAGVAYAQFERSVMLEDEVRARTRELEQALDLLNDSNAQLAQANAAAEAARANLANAIETVQEGFALFDADETLVMCNSRFGKHMRDIHHLFKPGLQFRDYVRLISESPFLSLPDGETPAVWAAKRLARHKDNHVVFNARMAGSRWLQVSEHRTLDGGTVVLQTDVTDMVLLERQERERLLDDQARLIKATLEHLNQGICIFDSAARLVGWNGRVGELLSIPLWRFRIGSTFDTIYEQLSRDIAFRDGADAQTLIDWAASDTRRAPLSFEIGVGIARTLAVFAQQMPDGGFVISFTDISAERAAMRAISDVNETLERRVMERTLELEDALAEAERANASKSRFVAAASHDLLQPLSAAKLYVASLESDLEDPALRDRLAKTNNALHSVEHILGALLDISRLDSGAASVDLGDIALHDMLAQLHDEMEPLAQDKGIEFTVDIAPVTVKSDATYLRRILQNLISNALRYTETGRVDVAVTREAGRIRVEIADTGPGIPEDQQEKVFDEFHRVNAGAGPAEGLGLGLAIVDRACRLLNHPLVMNSIPTQGTRFAIDLPMARSNRDLAAPERTAQGSAPLNRIVLLIENDAELREALALTLESWGADVLACATAQEAFALLAEIDIAPDVALADYQLDHGVLGTDAIAALHARFGQIPSCVITANRDATLKDTCAALGASLLYKPIDPEALRRFVLTTAPGTTGVNPFSRAPAKYRRDTDVIPT